MYNIEKITKIIKDIEKYILELEIMPISSVNDLDEKDKYYASSMLCFITPNRALDLGPEILVKSNVGIPSNYAEIFNNLTKLGIMNKKEAEDINKLISLRNVIAHAYFELTKKDVFFMIRNINKIEEFVEKVKNHVKRQNNSK